jgi:hypothetical protein
MEIFEKENAKLNKDPDKKLKCGSCKFSRVVQEVRNETRGELLVD